MWFLSFSWITSMLDGLKSFVAHNSKQCAKRSISDVINSVSICLSNSQSNSMSRLPYREYTRITCSHSSSVLSQSSSQSFSVRTPLNSKRGLMDCKSRIQLVIVVTSISLRSAWRHALNALRNSERSKEFVRRSSH